MLADTQLYSLGIVVLPAVNLIVQFLIGGALLLALFRLFIGPKTIDRVVALDLVGGALMALALYEAVVRDDVNYMNIGLIVALVSFLSTVAIARYLEKRAEDAHCDKR